MGEYQGRRPSGSTPRAIVRFMNLKKIFTVRNVIVTLIATFLLTGSFLLTRFFIVTMEAVGGLPGVAISAKPDASGEQAGVDGLPTPEIAAPSIELPPAWDGASRVNILLLGLDTEVREESDLRYQAERAGPARSDTMILLTFDPQTMTAGMLSIPRDLWVKIPGFDYAKINTAYYNGEAYKLPGGGPELAMQAVEQVIGVEIDYYAQIEFWAFTQLIDDVGKITVDVPKKIFIDPVGSGPDDIMLSAGEHRLGGIEALAYVRNRYTKDGDIDRSKRQQQVIIAFKNKVTDPANLPSFVAKAPQIWEHIQDGVKTNLTFNDIMKMGMMIKDIDVEKIEKGVIDYDMVILDNVVVNGENQSIMKPIPYKIRELRDQIFHINDSIMPLAQGSNEELALQEAPRIGIYNASSVGGLAQATADYFAAKGFNIVTVEQASYYPGISVLEVNSGSLYAVKYFQELFNMTSPAQIVNKLDSSSGVDIKLIISDDWAITNPMP